VRILHDYGYVTSFLLFLFKLRLTRNVGLNLVMHLYLYDSVLYNIVGSVYIFTSELLVQTVCIRANILLI